jgi:hypothetical protein
MNLLDAFEQKGLFRFTRLLALLIVCTLVTAVIAGLVIFTGTALTQESSYVKPEKVIDQVKPSILSTSPAPTGESNFVDPNALPGIKMPFSLQTFFSNSRNMRILLDHIQTLSDEQKQDYVDNMAEVVEKAKAQNIDIVEAVNAYFSLKDQELQRAQVEHQQIIQTRLYIAGAAISIMGLVALFSLILVLLAIERNTRRVVLQ